MDLKGFGVWGRFDFVENLTQSHMKTLLVLFSLLLVSLPSFGQSSERPKGIVIPVVTLGNVSETRRQILQNTLIESLSSYYRLVPQDKFEEVQEKVFEE